MTTPLGRGAVDRVLEATVVGSFSRLGPLVRRRTQDWTDIPSMTGRTVLVTGATSGLGLAATRRFAALGANVVGIGRNERVLDQLRGELGDQGLFWRFDLSDLDDVKRLAHQAKHLNRLDVIVHNAGALLSTYTPTRQDLETTFAVHVLAPYVMTKILGRSDAARERRVLFMTSGGMYTQPFRLDELEMTSTNYRGSVAYARAKRAQVVLVSALQRVEPPGGRRFYAVHPGWAATPGVQSSLPTFNLLTKPFLRTADQGVDGLVWLAATDPAPIGGGLWLDREQRPTHRSKRTVSKDDVGDEQSLTAYLDERMASIGM